MAMATTTGTSTTTGATSAATSILTERYCGPIGNAAANIAHPIEIIGAARDGDVGFQGGCGRSAYHQLTATTRWGLEGEYGLTPAVEGIPHILAPR